MFIIICQNVSQLKVSYKLEVNNPFFQIHTRITVLFRLLTTTTNAPTPLAPTFLYPSASLEFELRSVNELILSCLDYIRLPVKVLRIYLVIHGLPATDIRGGRRFLVGSSPT